MKINSFSRLFAAAKFRDYVESLPHLYEVDYPFNRVLKFLPHPNSTIVFANLTSPLVP